MAEDSITIKKDSLWKYSTFLLLAVIVIGGVLMFSGNSSTGNVADTGTDTQPGIISASVDDDAILGDPNAEITIIEFSDYQCPFCRKFWTETLPLIKSEYIDTGKARLVYRDFPLTSLHPVAVKSAEAAECARDLGGDVAYFEMHDKMFEEQKILDSGSAQGSVTKTVTYTTTDLKNWAKEIGYNIDSCLDSGKFSSEVQKDLADSQSAGGRGTPYFIIMKTGDKEGTPLEGAYPFEAFKQVIDSV